MHSAGRPETAKETLKKRLQGLASINHREATELYQQTGWQQQQCLAQVFSYQLHLLHK